MVERYYQIVTVWNRLEDAVRKLSSFWVLIDHHLQRNTLAALAPEGNFVVHQCQKGPLADKRRTQQARLFFGKGFFDLGNNFFD